MINRADENPVYLDTKQAVAAFKKGLTHYVGALERGDETGAARSSAATVGAYRKILGNYRLLPEELRDPLKEPLLSMYESLRRLELPVGDPPIEADPSDISGPFGKVEGQVENA